MRKLSKIVIFLGIVFLLSSCDDIKQIMSLVPKFETDLPNVISGNFAYYEDESNKYSELYTFNSDTKEFTYTNVYNGTKRGTYTYEYIDFNITICNGYLTLQLEDGNSEKYGFLYEATATDGPSSLTLNRNGQTRVYVYKGK